MIEHTYLHQILHNQFFLICSGGIVKENVVGQGSRISVSIWTCHIKSDQGGPLVRVAVIAPVLLTPCVRQHRRRQRHQQALSEG